MARQWIDVAGLANLRDLGGTPTTDGGAIAPGRLLRSDNLQDLPDATIEELLRRGLTDVVDLRSDYEVEVEGPGPLTKRDEVTIHQHSFFREWRSGVGEDKPDVRPDEAVPAQALPWVDLQPSVALDNELAGIYLSYVQDRPDSVVAALRDIAAAEGAVLVHCAAGKDRTGTLVALALALVGADREAIIADYAASTERIAAVVARLRASETYGENMRGRPLESFFVHPETMRALLDHIDAEFGGVAGLLERLGWTAEDTARLRVKLRS